MDITERKITKIARVAQRFAAQVSPNTGLGESESELLHFVRHHAGCTQGEARAWLNVDKAAVTRMVTRLETKGFLRREGSETDKRAKCLYALEKAEDAKGAAVSMETRFYEWLVEDISAESMQPFLEVLDRLYQKSKQERRANFANVKRQVKPDVETEA